MKSLIQLSYCEKPSISKLLAATKELKGSETVSRRYADVSATNCNVVRSLELTHPRLKS